MTLEAAACIWVSMSLAWATFALGLMVGVCLKRKDSFNDHGNQGP